MLSYLQSKHARLSRKAQAGDKLLLEPKSFLALISFLRSCRTMESFATLDLTKLQGTPPDYVYRW